MFGTQSFWMEEPAPRFSKLEKDLETGVVIVGAGIAGLTTAYLLAKEGKKVVILEKGTVGGGQTSRTTAHLTNAFDDRYYEMERLHGKEGAFIIAESHTKAIDLIERIVSEENIDCHFERLSGYLFSESEDEDGEIQKEFEAAQRAGVPGIERVDTVPWGQMEKKRALHFPNQGQIHARKYMNGLSRACVALGVEIYEETQVIDMSEGNRQSVTVKNGCSVKSQYILLATNSPINRNVAIHGRQSPYRSYVIGIEASDTSYPHVLAWDMKDPYHYVRLDKKAGHLLIVGGEDHRTGSENDMAERYNHLEEWAREHFSGLGKVSYRWSGQVMEPADGVAFIGKNPGSKNIFVITGDSGNGMTHGTLGGQIISDLILGRDNAWAELYNPSRLKVKALPKYIKDAGETNAYYKEWMKGKEDNSAENILKEDGAVFREGAKKVCIYRDKAGTLHKRSAVCPHLGCIVAWNKGEKSWDCPCHGSRFSPLGEVIEGPAVGGLPEEKI